MADLISFLSHRRGRYIDRSKFPDAGEEKRRSRLVVACCGTEHGLAQVLVNHPACTCYDLCTVLLPRHLFATYVQSFITCVTLQCLQC
jgi:hypothetical protein